MRWEWVWQLEEIDILIRDYGKTPVSEVAATLGRSVDSVTSEARRLGLSSPARFRHQADAQARNNPAVDVRFFEKSGPAVDQVVAFIQRWGHVYPGPRWLLRLRCPASCEPELLEVKARLRSIHTVRRDKGNIVLEIPGRGLIESFLRRYPQTAAVTT